MDLLFIFGQIVSVVALCCGAALSIYAVGTGSSEERGPRYPAEY